MIKLLYLLLKNNSPLYVAEYFLNRLTGRVKKPVNYALPRNLGGKQVLLANVKIFRTVEGKDILSHAEREKLLAYAERILQGKVDILGYKDILIGQPYDWHKDFISGFTWDKTVDYNHTGGAFDAHADAKIPWELSRSHHLVTLGQAYHLTRDLRYAEEFRAQISDWLAENPVEKGINWKCPMDVAIRAVNWIIAGYLFIECPAIPDTWWDMLVESLYVHMVYLRNHIEYGIVKGNHYLSDMVGLVFLGLLFSQTTYGESVLRYSLGNFLREMRKQVYPDGTDGEGSIGYHYLVTQLFLYTTIFLQRAGKSLPGEYLKKLEKMLEFIAAYIKPNGAAPYIGDVDDGRFIKYVNNHPTDHRHLLALGALLFKRPDFKEVAGAAVDDILWLYGRTGLQEYNALTRTKTGEELVNGPIFSRTFMDGGYYLFRDSNVYLLVRAGDIGLHSWGEQSHCDQLSFELCVGGEEIFIDPGTYIYTGDRAMHRLFRSTRSHNTVMIDELEQVQFKSYAEFLLERRKSTSIEQCVLSPEQDILTAKDYGYWERLGIVRNRQLTLDKVAQTLTVADTFEGAGNHLFEWFLHLAPDCHKLTLAEGHAVLTTAQKEIELTFPEELTAEVLDGYCSRSYGQKEPGKVLRLSTRANLAEKSTFSLVIKYPDC